MLEINRPPPANPWRATNVTNNRVQREITDLGTATETTQCFFHTNTKTHTSWGGYIVSDTIIYTKRNEQKKCFFKLWWQAYNCTSFNFQDVIKKRFIVWNIKSIFIKNINSANVSPVLLLLLFYVIRCWLHTATLRNFSFKLILFFSHSFFHFLRACRPAAPCILSVQQLSCAARVPRWDNSERRGKKEGRVSEREERAKRQSRFLGKTGALPALSSSVRPLPFVM